jgi:hypothetical protein
MNTKTSYVTIGSITTSNVAANGEVFNFSIAMTTNLSGLIRLDSYLTFTFTGDDDTQYTFPVNCYSGDTLIDTYDFTGLILPNLDETNDITAITLNFDYLDEIWRNINFTYKGSVTEKIQYSYVVS